MLRNLRTACGSAGTVALLTALFMTSCASGPRAQPQSSYLAGISGHAAPGFEIVTGPRPFSFPRDHGSHPDYQLEWWYFTGVLEDMDQLQYGYQLTLFRFAIAPVDPEVRAIDSKAFDRSNLLMGHLAVSDVHSRAYRSRERFGRAGGLAGGAGTDGNLRIWLDNWSISLGADGAWQVEAIDGFGPDAFGINLRMQTDQAPLLHGEAGYSLKQAETGQANFYYSQVQLSTVGTISLDGLEIKASGKSWMDHEWGTSALGRNASGWDWFGLNMEDGSALMTAKIRLKEGQRDGTFKSTWQSADGTVRILEPGELEIAETGQWSSPHSGIRYPASWTLTAPSLDLTCDVKPLIADQEFLGIAAYWEGAVAATCTLEESVLNGRGFAELTGYRPA